MGDNFERNRNGKKSYHPDRPLEKFCHEDSGRKGRVDPSQSLESVWISAEQPRDLPVAPEVSSPLRQETAQCGGGFDEDNCLRTKLDGNSSGRCKHPEV